MKNIMTAAALAVATLGASLAQAAETPSSADKSAAAEAARLAEREEMKRLGSYYLRCDGEPNNTTGGEDFARFMGAVTLLGLFAPSLEAADPAKRLFGEKGVEACNHLLDDPKEETNKLRRIPLILARALHQVEAKNYPAALADVDKARAEAVASGLSGNIYFDRSMGFSFDQVESVIRLRMDDPAKAEAVSLRSLAESPYGVVQLFGAETYDGFLPLTPAREAQLKALVRLFPATAIRYAGRLEEAGRFAEAARQHEIVIAYLEDKKPELAASLPLAFAALDHALAGDTARAAAREKDARDSIERHAAAGKPEDSAPTVVEVLDLLGIVNQAAQGKLTAARRMFASRSQWLGPGFGAVLEVNRRLRAGAAPDELFGALEKPPEVLWADRRNQERIRRIATDADNKTLFNNIFSYESVKDFEGTSKSVWRTDKSRLMLKEPLKPSQHWAILSPGGLVGLDAIVLHAALMAKARAKKGFLMDLHLKSPIFGEVSFVDPDEPGVAPERYLDADAVIAALSPLIPSPETLAARKAAPKS